MKISSQNPKKSQRRRKFIGSTVLVLTAAVACGHHPQRGAEKPLSADRTEWSEFAQAGPIGEEAASKAVPSASAGAQRSSVSRRFKNSEKKEDHDSRSPVSISVTADDGGAQEGASVPLEAVPEFNTEAYDSIVENRFVSVRLSPLSTFAVDVDTASYSNVRRFIAQGSKPPAGAVRIEELLNYFDYEYETPRGGAPFGVYTELSTTPWASDHQLLHIGIQGERITAEMLPPRNLVFLLDVSGSMDDPNKLPLLKRSMSALLETMGEKDTVSIVVYAGASGMVLPPTSAEERGKIYDALQRLEAGGSTNGGEGIELAYRAAQENFRGDGVNRVILATDGDFNIGTTSQSELVRLIEKKRNSGVFLTVLGFGMGNYKDSTLEQLADKGNGNYAYIDSFAEARKVLVEEGGATMVTIAKDVKIQVEMNPEYVGAYRLVGYENRALRAEDFNDDAKDAGEIGAGHTVTALYEILTPEQAARQITVDDLRYKRPDGSRIEERGSKIGRGEIATVKLRYKTPQGQRSRLLEVPVKADVRAPRETSDAFRFSAAVASFGMLLRDSEYKGDTSYGKVRRLAQDALGQDPHGHKHEFLELVSKAESL